MLLLAPNGAEVNVRDEAADRLLANGFSKPKSATRKSKSELLDEAAEECTNKELQEAVEKAKKSPAKPKRKKA